MDNRCYKCGKLLKNCMCEPQYLPSTNSLDNMAKAVRQAKKEYKRLKLEFMREVENRIK